MTPDLRALRTRLRLTQGGAAALFEVDLRTWQNWEAGRAVPGPARALAMVLLTIPDTALEALTTARLR